MDKEHLIKEKECIHCEYFFKCKGKPKEKKGEPCLYYKEDETNPAPKEY